MFKNLLPIILIINQCQSIEWMDRCRGDVMTANMGAHIARTKGLHPPEFKKIWEHCAACVVAAGKNRCSAPSIAVASTCACDPDNLTNCRCIESLSGMGVIVMAVVPSVLTFFVAGLFIFLCCNKSSTPKGFYVCFISIIYYLILYYCCFVLCI